MKLNIVLRPNTNSRKIPGHKIQPGQKCPPPPPPTFSNPYFFPVFDVRRQAHLRAPFMRGIPVEMGFLK